MRLDAAARELSDTFIRKRTALLNYARRRLPDADDAEDVVQASYLQLLEQRTRWQKRHGSWMPAFYAVIARRAVDERRRQLKKARCLEDAYPCGRPTAQELLEAQDLHHLIESCAGMLSTSQRRVLSRLLAGEASAEIACNLRVSVKTVQNGVSTIRRIVRTAIRYREAAVLTSAVVVSEHPASGKVSGGER